jgi:hypothetical protein
MKTVRRQHQANPTGKPRADLLKFCGQFDREDKDHGVVRNLEPLQQVSCRLGDSSCANAHATTLTRTISSIRTRNGASLLALQRQYGNRYVQRVLALAQGRNRLDGRIQRYDETTQPASRVWETIADISTGLSPGAQAARLIAARRCLQRLFGPMHTITFDRWIPAACRRSTTGYLHSREWDAFGHCWIGCEGTRRCGGSPTATLGTLRELQREIEARTGGNPHDSFSQDMNNQALGRELAFSGGTCYALCDGAHRTGALDLSAPVRVCANCSTYPAGGSDGPCPSSPSTPSSSTGW